MLFYLSKWYTKAELSLRMAIFYSGSLLSGAFGNLIAAGILAGLQGTDGMESWQWSVFFPTPTQSTCFMLVITTILICLRPVQVVYH